jgi:hypothetical protein
MKTKLICLIICLTFLGLELMAGFSGEITAPVAIIAANNLLATSDADLFDRLKQNIKDTLPAHLAVVDESWSTGHNVVVDGYNTDEYYHLNFGWGGSYNGWCLLPEKIPYELTVIEGVVVDIMKKLPAGVAESSADSRQSSVIIYPNPSSTLMTIELPSTSTTSNTFLTIYNLNGMQIYQRQITEQQSLVDVSGLPQEVYFVRVVDDRTAMVGKFVKQ